MIDFPSFLNDLNPYSDKFYITPIKENEIDVAEKRLQIKFPDYFRAFLRHIGLKQDLVSTLCVSFDKIIEASGELPKEIAKEFFPIGNSWGGMLLLKKETIDNKIFYLDGKTKNIDNIEEWYTDFEGLLSESAKLLIHTYKDRVSNSAKKWAVHFTINTNNEKLIYQVLSAKRLKRWRKTFVTDEKVNHYRSKMRYEGGNYIFFKSEHKDREDTSYSFSIEIPFLEIKADNIITRTEEKIKAVFESYGKTDYGILNFSDEE
jgi:hypothetical protein